MQTVAYPSNAFKLKGEKFQSNLEKEIVTDNEITEQLHTIRRDGEIDFAGHQWGRIATRFKKG